MRNLLASGFALMLVASAAVAAPLDYSGSWHSIAEKSSWSDGKFPKDFSLTITLKFEDNKLIYHSVNDTDKNAKSQLDWTASLDGTVVPIEGHPRFNQVAVTRLGPNQFQILEEKDGDIIVGAIWTFLPDKKTVVRWGVGKAPTGVSRAFTEYFVRQ